MTEDRVRLRAVEAGEAGEEVRGLRAAVDAAASRMSWLAPSDRALVEVALLAAGQLEDVSLRAALHASLVRDVDPGDVPLMRRLAALEALCDAVRAVDRLGPQIQGYLRDLGGTPASRRELAGQDVVGGRLEELRRGRAAGG